MPSRPHRRPRLLPGIACWLILLAAAPVPAQSVDEASPRLRHQGDLVSVFSGDIHVPADVTRTGNVVCIGCDVVVEGQVRGEVVVVLGSLELNGQVRGNVVGVLSDLSLRNAEISDQLINVLGGLDREETWVGGQVVNIGFAGDWFPGFWMLLLWVRILSKLAVFILIVLVVALAPERVRRIGDAAGERYVAAFFVGLLGYLGLIVVVTLLSVTVVGVPLALLGFWVMKWLGVAAIFYAVGSRVARAFGREASLLGSVLSIFLAYTVISLAPTVLGLPGLLITSVIGTLFFLLVALPAVGLVLLTRAGRDPWPVAPAPPLAPALPGSTASSGVGATGASPAPTGPPTPAPRDNPDDR